MKLTFEPLDLSLREPFTIARGTQTVAANVVARLGDGTHEGVGEAAPSEHYGELRGTVLALSDALSDLLREETSLAVTRLQRRMDEVVRLNPAAKAAVDIAAYDLLGKRLGVPVHQLLGVDPSTTPSTSFTIGIDVPEVMARKASNARDFPILKVKVGTDRDEENLEAIRAVRPDAIMRVDANEAWTAKQAVERIEALAIFDLEFVEQPVPAADWSGLEYVTSATHLPIIADESCVVPEDVPRVAPYVDGINIKLMKCGGIYPALQMIHIARAHHLKVMMGCMIESSVSISAAAQLSPLLDYADLDGNLLIDDDPWTGVQIDSGRLRLSNDPGLGLSEKRA